MATATKTNKSTENTEQGDETVTEEMTNPFAAMETVEASALQLPRRGRAVSEDTKRIRETLEKCLEDGTIRAIPCKDEEMQADLTRKIRGAAKMSGRDAIKISTRYDSHNHKLYFGPADNFDKLSKK